MRGTGYWDSGQRSAVSSQELSEAGFTGLKEVGNRSSLLQKNRGYKPLPQSHDYEQFSWEFPPTKIGNRSSLLQDPKLLLD